MSKAIIECVPNFSEGVDRERVLAIVRAMQVPGVSLLDWSQDPDHNRSVVTIAGPPAAVVEAAVLAAGKAAEVIDLTRQTGVHPRIGAADVIPFVPVRDISLEHCALLARQAGEEIWEENTAVSENGPESRFIARSAGFDERPSSGGAERVDVVCRQCGTVLPD